MEYNEFLAHVQEKINMDPQTTESENTDIDNDEQSDEEIYGGTSENEQNDSGELQSLPQYEKLKESLAAL